MAKRNRQTPPGHRLVIDWPGHIPSATYAHKYGGIPSNGAALPICSGCGHSLHLLFQIDLTDPGFGYLQLADLDYLFVLTCLNCASYEETMFYSLLSRGRKITILREKPGMCVTEYPDVLEEHLVSCRPLENDEYLWTEEDLFRLLDQEGKHQVGGIPIWVQKEERVLCARCCEEMQYIAMVDTELYIGENGFREKGHMFGDRGILYMFICRRCGIFAVEAQCF
jgi:hypothetical protein